MPSRPAKRLSDAEIRAMLLQAGVANLKEFGYPSVTTDNILSDLIYRQFFLPMLRENIGKRGEVDRVIGQLIAEIDARGEATDATR